MQEVRAVRQGSPVRRGAVGQGVARRCAAIAGPLGAQASAGEARAGDAAPRPGQPELPGRTLPSARVEGTLLRADTAGVLSEPLLATDVARCSLHHPLAELLHEQCHRTWSPRGDSQVSQTGG